VAGDGWPDARSGALRHRLAAARAAPPPAPRQKRPAVLADTLFSVHMAEHLLLLMVAPPLIWLGAPLVPTLWAFPHLLPAFLLNVLLGAMLAFAGQPLHRAYQAAARTSSLSVVEDQQLGGIIMWIPGGMMYLIPLAVVIGILLREESVAGAENRL
jgi:cytochrome c oxidase assembly factor CtaG